MVHENDSSLVDLGPLGSSAGGESLSDLWSPTEEQVQTHQPTDLGQLLLESGAVDADR